MEEIHLLRLVLLGGQIYGLAVVADDLVVQPFVLSAEEVEPRKLLSEIKAGLSGGVSLIGALLAGLAVLNVVHHFLELLHFGGHFGGN